MRAAGTPSIDARRALDASKVVDCSGRGRDAPLPINPPVQADAPAAAAIAARLSRPERRTIRIALMKSGHRWDSADPRAFGSLCRRGERA